MHVHAPGYIGIDPFEGVLLVWRAHRRGSPKAKAPCNIQPAGISCAVGNGTLRKGEHPCPMLRTGFVPLRCCEEVRRPSSLSRIEVIN